MAEFVNVRGYIVVEASPTDLCDLYRIWGSPFMLEDKEHRLDHVLWAHCQ